jgi:hypothetical protein
MSLQTLRIHRITTTTFFSEVRLKRTVLHLQTQPPELHARLYLQHPRLRPPIRQPAFIPRTFHHPSWRWHGELGVPLPTTNV